MTLGTSSDRSHRGTRVLRILAAGIVIASAPACAGAGHVATSATDTDAASTSATATTESTDGMSSTSAASTTTTTTTTTGATTTTTTTTTGESSTGCGFICIPDVLPPAGECDLWTQNCPEGEKCMPWANDGGSSWNASKCTPIDPDPDAVGEPCTVEGSRVSGIDSCVLGAMCWLVDPKTDTGVCFALCQGVEQECVADPASCCPPGTTCTIDGSGVLILCKQTCHPLVQACEGSGEVCYPVGNAFQCAPDVSGEMGAAGDPCEFINACDPGTFCGNPAAYPGCDPMAGGCCIPFCELGVTECPKGTECAPWYDPMDAPPGYADLGACVIPS